MGSRLFESSLWPQESESKRTMANNGSLEPKEVSNEVLAELLPGDDSVSFPAPSVGGGVCYRFAKRAVDVLASTAALAVLAVPIAVVAVLVKMESPGPVIYSQVRAGWKGKPFRIYKFRSMYVDAEEEGPCWAAKNDNRVTPLGRKLRDSRFDEVPQFVNVIKGDMSLVGPRPERPVFCDAFEQRISGWHYRNLVRPGISGLAQVVGGYEMLPGEKIAFDLEYIEKRSFLLDLKILLQTLSVVVNKRSVR